MQKYDVVLYNVKYDDTDEMKQRPIIILDAENDYAIATSCTTHRPRSQFFGEYVLQDYKQAGLNKPTTARLSKIVDVNESNIIRHLGKLSIRDIENIETLLYGNVQINSSYNEVNNKMILDESLFEDVMLVEKLSDVGYKPNKTGTAYKVFRVKNGKLYPPMVANRNNEPTPIGVWLDAEEGEFAGLSKTGRPQVKSKGSTLAYRPGWHLGDVPRAKQFDRTNKETGEKEFPADFVWAECEYAMDVDYQDEADARGYERTKVDDEGNVIVTKSDKYQHSLAGLPKLPKDGYYKYRTNPNPDTVPWVITGQIKVNRLLDDFEVNEILKRAGVAPIHRQGGDKTLAELGLNNLSESISEDVIISTDETEEKTIEPENNGISMIINNLIKDEYESIDSYNSAITTFKDIGKSDDAISVLNDIVAEENIHVGQLQRLMELFDPNADKVSDGVEEASEQIENDLDMSDEEFLEKFAEWYDPTKGNSFNYDTSAIPNYSNPVNESAGTDNTVDMSCSNCTDDADEDEFLKGFENLMNR